MENSRIEKAVNAFKTGATCSQAVFVTYANIFGMDEETAMKISCPFGRGLGGMNYVCGTISGMTMISGLYNGMSSVDNKEQKKENFNTVKFLIKEFVEEFGSVRCSQLLGMEPGLPEGKKKRPCEEYIRFCANLIEQYMVNNGRLNSPENV